MNLNWLRLRKWRIWIALGLAILIGGVGLKFWLQKNAAPDYKTVKIEKGAITASVSASGTLSPVVSVQVGSQVSGQLKEILVDFNSEVKKDQLIARIDPETFEYKVRQAQADLDVVRAQLGQVEVNTANAKRDLDRKQQLMEKGFISGADRDTVLASYRALAEQVKSARAQVKQREAALAQANIDLERTAIKAPVNGIVIKRSVERGQTVAASLQSPELFIIAENLADMQVDTAIDESEIGRIQLAQKATFTVDAFPGRTFAGEVKQIRKAAQTVSNVVTYTVAISASNPNKELLPGMTANVRIVIDSRNDVLKVANAALRFKPAGTAGVKPAAAESQTGGTAAGGGQNKALRERLEKELQLSADQKTKLDTIFAGLRDKMAGSRDAAPAERQKTGERNRADMRVQIADMLTPEQKKKYEEINAEQGDRRSAGARGRIYALDANRQPKELTVRLGLSDGTMTEVIAPEVKEGMEIISGIVQPQSGSAKPAAPAGPRMF